jgi:hypothetical protein
MDKIQKSLASIKNVKYPYDIWLILRYIDHQALSRHVQRPLSDIRIPVGTLVSIVKVESELVLSIKWSNFLQKDLSEVSIYLPASSFIGLCQSRRLSRLVNGA